MATRPPRRPALCRAGADEPKAGVCRPALEEVVREALFGRSPSTPGIRPPSRLEDPVTVRVRPSQSAFWGARRGITTFRDWRLAMANRVVEPPRGWCRARRSSRRLH